MRGRNYHTSSWSHHLLVKWLLQVQHGFSGSFKVSSWLSYSVLGAQPFPLSLNLVLTDESLNMLHGMETTAGVKESVLQATT